MTRTTVSGIRPDKTGTGEWIDINSHVGRLMSTIMAGGRPFGMTIVTPLPPPAAGPDTEAASGNDSKTGTDPDKGQITSRKTLYERFKTRLNENLAERKQ